MTRALFVCVVACAGCYDIDSFVDNDLDASVGDSDVVGDGGVVGDEDGATDGAPRRVQLWAGALGGTGSSEGTGTEAHFAFPSAVTVDTDDTIYVADSGPGVILRVQLGTPRDAAHTMITRMFGTPWHLGQNNGLGGTDGGTTFANPRGLVQAFKPGQIYVADQGDYSIRVLNMTSSPETSTASTLTGGPGLGSADGVAGVAKFLAPFGLTADATYLYVSDFSDETVRRVDQSGTVLTIAGVHTQSGPPVNGLAVTEKLSYPTGLAVANGMLFVAEKNNNVVRAIDSIRAGGTNQITTVAGIGPASCTDTDNMTGALGTLCAPVALAFDPTTSELWIPDRTRIRTLGDAPSYPLETPIYGLSTFGGVGAIATTSTGVIVLGDSTNHQLAILSPNGDKTYTPAIIGGSTTQQGSGGGVGTDARFNKPTGLATAKGVVYVADQLNSTIRVIDESVSVSSLALMPTACATSTMPIPAAVTIGDDGKVYYLDNSSSALVAIAGGKSTTLVGPQCPTGSPLSGPLGLAQSGNDIYIADTGNNVIQHYDIDSGVVKPLTITGVTNGCALVPGLASPTAVILDGTELYIAATGNCLVLSVDLSQSPLVAKTVAGTSRGTRNGATNIAQFDAPNALALDAARTTLYVADTGAATVRAIDLINNRVSTYAGQVYEAGALPGIVPNARLNRMGGMVFVPGTGLIVSIPDEEALLRIY